MDAKQQAEYDRLSRAFTNGPCRRMVADKMAGRPPTQDDTAQAERYLRLMTALKEGRA